MPSLVSVRHIIIIIIIIIAEMALFNVAGHLMKERRIWPNYCFPTGTIFQTSAVLRLECSIDCISGSVGHQHFLTFIFSLSAFLLKKNIQKKLIKNI